jgi:hypothetical protein
MAKTRRKRLKQFAILNASKKITFFPEIHSLSQNPTFCQCIMVLIGLKIVTIVITFIGGVKLKPAEESAQEILIHWQPMDFDIMLARTFCALMLSF